MLGSAEDYLARPQRDRIRRDRDDEIVERVYINIGRQQLTIRRR